MHQRQIPLQQVYCYRPSNKVSACYAQKYKMSNYQITKQLLWTGITISL